MSGTNIELIIALAALIILMLNGCADKVVCATQEVLVPVKCAVDIPPRPQAGRSPSESVANIIVGYEEMRALLTGCVE